MKGHQWNIQLDINHPARLHVHVVIIRAPPRIAQSLSRLQWRAYLGWNEAGEASIIVTFAHLNPILQITHERIASICV